MIWRTIYLIFIGLVCTSSVFAQPDISKPSIEGPIFIARDTFKYIIRDNSPLDTGIKDIIVNINNGDTSFIIQTIPELVLCSRQEHTIVCAYKHGWFKGGMLEVNVSDCAGNLQSSFVLTDSYDYWEPKVLSRNDTGATIKSVVVGDTDRFGSGLSYIKFLNFDSTLFRVTISPPLQPCELKTYTITVEREDTSKGGCVFVRLVDCDQNRTDDSICFEGVSVSVDYEATAESCELIGNPATGMTTLRIRLAASESVGLRIVDIAGRVVRSERLGVLGIGTNDIPIVTNYLSEGTYYVIAEFGGRQYAKKLQVLK